MSVLSVAAANGHTERVEVLLKDPRIYINPSDPWGWTAVYHAAFQGHDDVLSILVADERAEVDMPDADGLTALWWASTPRQFISWSPQMW
jgi:ankyrin repeat protein